MTNVVDNVPITGSSVEWSHLKNANAATPETSKKAAAEFEAFMIGYIFNLAYKTVPKSGLLGDGSTEEIYQSMFINEVATKVAESGRGFGLAQQLLPKGVAATPDPKPAMLWDESLMAGFDLGVPPTAISSAYGERKNPLTGHPDFHDGIDVALPMGSPIRAVAEGKVVFSGQQRGYGNVIIIEHPNGLRTLYGHNSENHVQAGDAVSRGQAIGLTGNTGRSTGPHLHFEVRKGGEAINPRPYLSFRQKV